MMATMPNHGHTRALPSGSKQVSMFAVTIPFILITSIVVVLRVHVRLRLLRGGLGLDDCFMVVGFTFTIALSVANMLCGHYGAGLHADDIPPSNMVPLLKSNYATRLLYIIAICFVKFSILVFYLRVDQCKPMRWAVYSLMTFVAALSVISLFIMAFVCMPPSLFWDPTAQAAAPGKCLRQSAQQLFFNVNGICNIIQDVTIYLLPIPMLWNLQMPIRQKLVSGTLLSVGLVAVAASCIRFYYILFLADEADMWFYMADSLNWCSIELYAAITCASAATFKALLKTYAPCLWGPSQRSGPASAPAHHGYKPSANGRFAVKPYGAASMASDRSLSNRKYGIADLTTVWGEDRGREGGILISRVQVVIQGGG